MATITATARPVRSRTDDIFFTLMSLVMLGTVLFGFAHTYFLAGMVMAPLPSVLVHVHGAAFTCWILLFLVQTVLIGNGKVRLHRTLGWAGAFLAAAMMVLGLLATSAAIRRGITPPGFTTPSFLLLNDSEVIVFAALVAWAVAVRYDKPIHKRLMLLATLVLMGPAISRWPLHMIVEKPQTIGLFFFIELFSVLVFDLITRHKPYWQTIVVTLAIVALKPLAEGVSHTLAVQHLLEWVMRG